MGSVKRQVEQGTHGANPTALWPASPACPATHRRNALYGGWRIDPGSQEPHGTCVARPITPLPSTTALRKRLLRPRVEGDPFTQRASGIHPSRPTINTGHRLTNPSLRSALATISAVVCALTMHVQTASHKHADSPKLSHSQASAASTFGKDALSVPSTRVRQSLSFPGDVGTSFGPGHDAFTCSKLHIWQCLPRLRVNAQALRSSGSVCFAALSWLPAKHGSTSGQRTAHHAEHDGVLVPSCITHA